MTFQIKLSPQRRDDSLSLEVNGDILTVNGEKFDFKSLPNGATIPFDDLPPDGMIVGDVHRIDGVIHVTVLFPIGPEPTHAQAFPEPIIVSSNGPVALPENEENGDLET